MSKKRIRNIISNIFTIILIIVAIIVYRKYDFNFFFKGVSLTGKTEFTRDAEITSNKDRSYKIENKEYNDAMFYKEISVKQNTPYKVSCMIKTKDVEQSEGSQISGAQIVLKDSEEHSKVLSGNTDWTKVEFCFNSKNSDTISIGFRLGGNTEEAKGTAWFSDLQIEEGFLGENTEWKFACFIFNSTKVELENGKIINEQMNNGEIDNLKYSMNRFKNSMEDMTDGKMTISYDTITINEPITTLTYDESNGYYVSEKDIYNQIQSYMEEKEYDHIFACIKLPDEQDITNLELVNWIGLGNMEYCGKGFSNIRISNDDNSVKQYTYSSTNLFPEEVYVHEFLHTLERNSKEYGYTIPALHDYEKYGYKEDNKNGLRIWYSDYMNKNIKSGETLIGLPNEIYGYKPIQLSNFEYSNKLTYLDEPKNIGETFKSIISKVNNLFNQQELKEKMEGAAE